jgi:hypothetical protein
LHFIYAIVFGVGMCFAPHKTKSLIMKRLILFSAVLLGLATITQAQTSEKVKTKIEGQSFKKKTKTEGDAQSVLTSSSAHPAYVHHYTTKAPCGQQGPGTCLM